MSMLGHAWPCREVNYGIGEPKYGRKINGKKAVRRLKI